MNTPIFDFVSAYAKSDAKRLHMPGHKGISLLGCERLDITEIDGADSLYEANGIIKESESNASLLFGCNTFYSTEGASQCIRAMLYLAMLDAKSKGKKPKILATRNVHKVFLSALALLDLDAEWIYGKCSYLSCETSAADVENAIIQFSPTALYITSPDYLGNIMDIRAIADVCKKHDVLLLCDSAHGAYLKFLETSLHPIDLGADICCSSAHKTLPVLTGGAYLHVKDSELAENAKNALAIFGSTSPSYLILQSLDLANKYLDGEYRNELDKAVAKVAKLKNELIKNGYTLIGSEPLKITISAKAYGYSGTEFSDILKQKNIICEFADPDFTVLMITPQNQDLQSLKDALLNIQKRTEVLKTPPAFQKCERVMSVRDASLCASETVPVSKSLGRVLAVATVGCPPAVPIVMCGERIDENAVECFKYYGIEKCSVVKEL